MSNQHPSLPEVIEADIRRATRLEYWTLFWLATIIGAMYLVTGSSQAMKTAWIEDCLSLVPPLLFILAAKIERRPPTRHFPYGFHRVGSLAFFGAACALLAMGAFLLFEACSALVTQEHPTIGTVAIFGERIWLGWLMIPTLAYSVIAPVILGRMKRPLARRINDKILHTDADMNAADWHTGLAGILGIAGIAFGYWWADSLAAGVISLSIVKDGWRNSRVAIAELLDGAPRAVDSTDISRDAERIAAGLGGGHPGIDVRVRETGRYMRAAVTAADRDTMGQEEAEAILGENAWRLIEVSVSVDAPQGAMREAKSMVDTQRKSGCDAVKGDGDQ
ncbi:cation diffusion facilitator family transporter [Pararhizobium haloflavum]|uniref:cation diffusion facilitator family transporter n=1 Tax=Pararhizobium haloflavum TaxID=2037914 RepID=UPI000C1885AE|nr:cation diffusion facilitator family transporter [Pararhizobium haloflavum]